MKEITVKAEQSQLDYVTQLLDEELGEDTCAPRTRFQLEVALEELFVNICSYAYPGGEGTARLVFDRREDPSEITITFEDSGIPFDPLAGGEADLDALLSEDAGPGGLGIHMVQKSMDDMRYEYKNGKNILTITKKLP